jgi:hypothetical protein
VIKIILNVVSIVVILAVVVFSYCVLNGHVIVARTSAESADLTADQLADFKHKAIDQGDRQAAARIYWYYRFTKKDYSETKKWKYAVESYPGEDDGLPK